MWHRKHTCIIDRQFKNKYLKQPKVARFYHEVVKVVGKETKALCRGKLVVSERYVSEISNVLEYVKPPKLSGGYVMVWRQVD